jgi:hypothetical protein
MLQTAINILRRRCGSNLIDKDTGYPLAEKLAISQWVLACLKQLRGNVIYLRQEPLESPQVPTLIMSRWVSGSSTTSLKLSFQIGLRLFEITLLFSILLGMGRTKRIAKGSDFPMKSVFFRFRASTSFTSSVPVGRNSRSLHKTRPGRFQKRLLSESFLLNEWFCGPQKRGGGNGVNLQPKKPHTGKSRNHSYASSEMHEASAPEEIRPTRFPFFRK